MEKLKMEAEKNLQTAIEHLEKGDHKNAVKYLELAYKGGNQQAHLMYADAFNNGTGVEKDLKKAFSLYEELGNSENISNFVCFAQFNLSVMCMKGYGTEPNREKSISWIKKSADNGFPTAQHTYGYFLENGANGVEENIKEAERYYIRAATAGHTDAMANLVMLYANNEGFEDTKYLLKTIFWLTRASENGNQQSAQYLEEYKEELGDDFPSEDECFNAVVEDYEWALKLQGELPEEEEEELDESEMLLEKGFELMHKNGDNEGAFNAWKKSYELGNINAAYYLAQCYDMAIGTENNAEKGFELYLECAEKVENEDIKMKAEYNVGNGYFNGNGVERDYKKAFEWYTKAADDGHSIAQFNLALCYFNGNHVDTDFNKAFHYASLASENGNVQAMGILGTLYLSGLGANQDIEKAKHWFKVASEKGDFKAKQIYEQILRDEKK